MYRTDKHVYGVCTEYAVSILSIANDTSQRMITAAGHVTEH
jgi:hypothetical protein